MTWSLDKCETAVEGRSYAWTEDRRMKVIKNGGRMAGERCRTLKKSHVDGTVVETLDCTKQEV